MVNDSTRGYSVYVTDENNTVQGSGVLFYAGGDTMFVFTCAHVVEGLEKVRLFILREIDASIDEYDAFVIEIPSSQIVFARENADDTQKDDLAIMQIARPADIELTTTEYYITETRRTRPVYVQGYPNGVPTGKHPIEYLDCLHGQVIINQASSNQFTIRIDDPAVDSGNRVYELRGLSGAPVWDDDDKVNGLLGLLTSAYDTTALLSKVRATKAQQIRSIMMDRFGVLIKRKLEGIPEEDVSGGFNPTVYSGKIKLEEKSENEKWIEYELTSLRVIIEDLKLQKAIDKGQEIVADPRYETLSKDSRKRVKQYLLYCYEIADMDDEFEALEADMRESGLIKEHDTLRLFTRTFMKRKFQETIDAAQHCIDTWDGSNKDHLLSFAKTFLLLSKAYTENLPVEETIGKLLDDNENFNLPTDDIEDEALIYQMIGYVYGEHYHDHVQSVRFLNRSYQVGFDSMVLETLAAAYYNLAVFEATDENGKIPDWRKIDQKALYKARECYLIIRGKADDLFWSGTMRRMGLCVYNTFFFLQDNYRILTIYPDIKKYLTMLTDDEWRDVEMKYAKISAQKGEINTGEFPHITTKDRILLDAIARASKCGNLIEDVTANVPADQIKNIPQFAKEIRETTRELESAVRRIDRNERVPMYVQMINLYGRGMLMFGWDKIEKLNDLYQRLLEYADEDLLESMSNFIFEMNHPIDESIIRFKATFEKKKNIITWQELNHLYIRHGMFDEADAMYSELLSKRKELIEDGPEYAYRAFIDYVTLYKRDLKYALQCYLDAKESFQDTDIEGFWELELMLYSNSFNDPERFEVERRHFVDKGLVTEESYHRAAFIAYLTNLNEEKAAEHNNYIRQYPHYINPQNGSLIVSKEEIHFLNWIGAVKPGFLPPRNSMNPVIAAGVWNDYFNENWHKEIDQSLKNQFAMKKTIAIDSWGLYQLVEANALKALEELDCVYVTHMTIIRLFEELSQTNNVNIRKLLDFLKKCSKVRIQSAEFKAQIDVRAVANYFEPASTVAIAIEKDCPFIYGEPHADDNLIEYFGNRLIRVNEIEQLIGPLGLLGLKFMLTI